MDENLWSYEELEDGTLKLIEYLGDEVSVTIPAKIGNKAVSTIGCNLFLEDEEIQAVEIQEGIKFIGDFAFSECSSLQSIEIPDSVTSIGEGAFSECSSLQSIDIPNSVKEIGHFAFYNCTHLERLNISDGIKIGEGIFDNCPVEKFFNSDYNALEEDDDGEDYEDLADKYGNSIYDDDEDFDDSDEESDDEWEDDDEDFDEFDWEDEDEDFNDSDEESDDEWEEDVPQYDLDDESRLRDIAYLKSVYRNFDIYDSDEDIDALYCYAQMLYSGNSEVEEDKERAIRAFALIFENLCLHGFSYNEYDSEDWEEGGEMNLKASKYKDIFLSAEYFTEEKFDYPNEYLLPMAEFIQKGIPNVLEADPKRAFELVYDAPFPPPRMLEIGGFGLVQMLKLIDSYRQFLAECYMNGQGTEQNLENALSLFLSIGTNYLVQKWYGNPFLDYEFEELYEKLEDSVRKDLAPKTAMENYYALALMTMEGLGCDAYPSLAKDYFAKAAHIYYSNEEYYNNFDYKYIWYFDKYYLSRLIKYDAKPYSEDMDLNPEDHIYLGKYNNRSVSWKVLDVEDGKALLLSDEILESSGIFNEGGFDWKDRIDYIIEDIDDYDTSKCFLLNPDMVEEYLPDPDYRICFCREQAARNLTDDEESGNNHTEAWWLECEEDGERPFVDENGEIDTDNYHRRKGIRPAMYLNMI